MKRIFLFIILIVSQKIITQENFDFFSENKIYELNDTSFEEITTIGRAYRWLILFYSYTANSEYIDAIKEVKNIFDSYKNLNELRFAQMNVDNNIITKIRLDINKIPNLILLENNTMLEMNSTLNHENMEGFIFTIFSDVKEYLKPLPQKITPTYAKWVIYKKSFEQFLNQFNQDLMNKGIRIQFNIYGFIISVIILVIISFYVLIFFFFLLLVFFFLFHLHFLLAADILLLPLLLLVHLIAFHHYQFHFFSLRIFLLIFPILQAFFYLQHNSNNKLLISLYKKK